MKWGALAAGFDTSSPVKHVAIGATVNRWSKMEAERRALAACSESGDNCRIVGTFVGCGYITSGKGPEGTGLVAWGKGRTPQAAYDNCMARRGVQECHTHAIGGCNDE